MLAASSSWGAPRSPRSSSSPGSGWTSRTTSEFASGEGRRMPPPRGGRLVRIHFGREGRRMPPPRGGRLVRIHFGREGRRMPPPRGGGLVRIHFGRGGRRVPPPQQ